MSRVLKSGARGGQVLRDPAGALRRPSEVVAALLRCDLYGLEQAELASRSVQLVVIWLRLAPWQAMAAEGYPTERVSLCIWRDGAVYAIPHRAESRDWLHRNVDDVLHPGSSTWDSPERCHLGELCLWFPDDPRGLRWEWSDGLDQLVTVVHRHVQAEEYWRRHDRWPAEDTPHGSGEHSVRTLAMRAAAERWRPAC